MKILVHSSGRRFYVKDPSSDYHCTFGLVKAADLKKDGAAITSNTGAPFTVLSPTFLDMYSKIRRGPQIIPLKDVGAIITGAGITKTSTVVEAGSGSGALCCYLAAVAKKVISYEIREDFHKLAKENAQYLGLKNAAFRHKDVTLGIAEKNVDAVIFDMPNPWDAIGAAAKALKSGGALVCYSPTIPQIMDTVQKLDESKQFAPARVIELIERDWEVQGRKTRPLSQQIGHSGFLLITRKIT